MSEEITKRKRVPIEFKQYDLPAPKRNDAPVQEMIQQHRSIKLQMLDLIEKISTPNYTKQRIQNELFQIYKEFK